MAKILLWLAILTLFFTAVGALASWGGPVLQALVEHALSEGAAAAGASSPPAP